MIMKWGGPHAGSRRIAVIKGSVPALQFTESVKASWHAASAPTRVPYSGQGTVSAFLELWVSAHDLTDLGKHGR